MTQHSTYRFPYLVDEDHPGEASLRPLLPLDLGYQGRSIASASLLDTGAMVNVLPYGLGLSLGAVWEEQATPLRLTGNLAQFDPRALLISATVADFTPVQLACAWTLSDDVPLLLGQVNFFMEFDVCFFRSQRFLEVSRKSNLE